MFRRFHAAWIERADEPLKVATRVAVPTDAMRREIAEYPDVVVTNPPKVGMVHQAWMLTRSVQGTKDDIVVIASDDMLAPRSWDSTLRGLFRDFDGCIVVNLGDNRAFPGRVALPIMTYNCLLRLNRVPLHPDYHHCRSDAELYENLQELGLLRDMSTAPEPVFEHVHWFFGKRQQDDWDRKILPTVPEDRKIYEVRRRMSLEERLRPPVSEPVEVR
jgi:hypothetical protein